MLEKAIQKSILDYLGYRQKCFWRNNSGAMVSEYKGRQRFMRFGENGSPDIFVVKNGNIYGLEVKNEKGKQSDSQKEWEDKFTKAGGIYKVVRSLEDVQALGL